MITVVCDLEKNNDDIIKIELLNDRENIFLRRCEQNDFCEQLPSIISDAVAVLEKKYGKSCKNEVKYKVNFDIKKHLTTYRIFTSFINGFMIDI